MRLIVMVSAAIVALGVTSAAGDETHRKTQALERSSFFDTGHPLLNERRILTI
jgi:hypothetical protein